VMIQMVRAAVVRILHDDEASGHTHRAEVE